jgi:hypothetical protein
MKYRKKPIVIEAFQMTEARRSNNTDWPEWLNYAWNKEISEVGSVSPKDFPNSTGTDKLCVQTLEGPLNVDWDDYIIRGIQGELYPCKPDIFESTYDPVE